MSLLRRIVDTVLSLYGLSAGPSRRRAAPVNLGGAFTPLRNR